MPRRGNGEGSIAYRQDKDLWEGRLTLDTGKRKSVYGKTRSEVAAKMREMNATDVPDPTRARVDEWLCEWLMVYKSPEVRQSTMDSYSMQIRVHLSPAIGGYRLRDLSPAIVQRFLNEKSSALSPKSVRYLRMILAAACKKAVELRMISMNPCDHVKGPGGATREIRPFTQKQMDTFMDTARGHKLWPAFLLEWSTGLRRGELLGLRWEDIDLVRGIVSVRQSLILTSRGPEIAEPKTRTGRRSIPIPAEVVEVLRKHKATQDNARRDFGLTWESEFVFCGRGGKTLHPKVFYKTFRTLCRKAEVPEVAFHDMRHSHATLLLAMGVNPKVAQERLGHASITVTMDTYSHVVPSMQQEVAEKLGLLLR